MVRDVRQRKQPVQRPRGRKRQGCSTFGQDNESGSEITVSCPCPGFSFQQASSPWSGGSCPGSWGILALTLTDPTSSVSEPIRDLNSDV